MPASVLERAPSAELRPDQRDEDSLPPYELLDRILEAELGDVEFDPPVDDEIPEEVLKQLLQIPGFTEARSVTL